MARRTRRRGEGSIRKVHCKCSECLTDNKRSCPKTCSHKDRWRAVWYCDGCDDHPHRGKHSKQFVSEGTARTHLRERLTAKAKGEQEPSGHHTFDELAEIWLAVKKGKKLKTKTIVGYQSILLHHLLPKFGSLPVRKISTAMVDAFVAEIERESNTVRNVYRVMYSIMDYGAKIDWIDHNPCAAELPNGEDKPKITLTPEELEALAMAAEDSKWEALIRFAGWTGMRSGELSALRVKHLNPLKGTVTVKRSVGKVEREFVEGPTKTYRERTLQVVPSAMGPVLDLVEGRGPDELVFQNGHVPPDNYLAPNQILDVVRKAAKVALPAKKQGINVHELRHTHASILIVYLGADIATVQKRLGHKNASTTLDIYSHWFPEREDELVEAMEALAQKARTA